MNRRPGTIFSLLVTTLLVACGGGEEAAGAGEGGFGGDGPPPTAVEVAEAFRDTVVDAIVATGEIEARHQVSLRPDVGGRITEILFEEGRRVAAGAALIKIDDAELKAEVARAEAERDLANQALERTTKLVEERAASAADLERAEAAARAAGASLELLSVRLDRTVVKAPFAGIVGQRMISVGDYVTPQTELLTISTVSPQRVVFNVPERYLQLLARGQDVSFRVAALPGKTFSGRVDFVDPVVTLPARTIAVKAVVANPRGELVPGMFVEVRLATETRNTATVIPEEAVSPVAGGAVVWVAEQGVAVMRPVQLGVRTPGFVEVLTGVSVGEMVVVGGIERLYPGANLAPTVVERQPQGGTEG